MSQPAPAPPRHSRGLSFRSDRSGGSKREEIVESPLEKQRRDNLWSQGSKANPNAALQEAQPGDYALLERATIGSLRGVQHKDAYGNLITDPDLSNPTRPRFERPLDTIRSFERAIDNGYKRRSSYQRSESYDQSNQQYAGSRRSSYYGNDSSPGPSKPQMYGYGPRPDTQSAVGAHPSPRTRYGRMQSDSQIVSPRPYAQHAHHASHDTMHTGMTSQSDSTGPWANSTEPSSDNSSFDRVAADYSPGYGPGVGPNGFAGGIPEEGGAYPMAGRAPPVQPPPHARRPIPLGGDGAYGQAAQMPAAKLPTVGRPEPEKRKSWLKRTFSRKNSD